MEQRSWQVIDKQTNDAFGQQRLFVSTVIKRLYAKILNCFASLFR